jgi:nitronate monooxygenase
VTAWERSPATRSSSPRLRRGAEPIDDLAAARAGVAPTLGVFAGHNAYRFAADPFYSNGYIPSVKELVARIATGA